MPFCRGALRRAAAAATVAGVIVGAPALRIRGIYVMILTLGFGEIVRVFFLNFEPTGGASGMGGIRPLTELWQVVARAAIALLLVLRNPARPIRPRHDCDARRRRSLPRRWEST